MGDRYPNRWLVFSAGFIINFFVSAAAIFSVVAKPMTQLRGWSMTEFSLAFSVYTLFLAVFSIFSGRVVDAFGARINMYVGAVLFGAGWAFTGRCTTLTQLYLVYGVLAGTGGGIIYNSVIVTVLRWFPDRRGKASGMLLAAAAIGPFTLAPLASVIMGRVGVVATFAVLGTLFFVAISGVGWLMASAPVGYQPEGWNPSPAQAGAASGRDRTWRAMLASPLFWSLLAIFVCACTAGTMMINSISLIAQKQMGVAATAGALAVSVSTALNFVGRLSFGAIYDRIGGFKAVLVSLALTIVALLALMTAQSMALFLACVVLLGFAFGGMLVIYPPITGKYFGIKNLGVNYGIMFLGYAGAAFVGPRIASHFYDTTGSFRLSYLAAAAVTALG
ncbi:MAG TPA: OFA family MFS transporter, partial [Holophaga sp.]|nr:OFA family MFS transporter [Holophaga sp.]